MVVYVSDYAASTIVKVAHAVYTKASTPPQIMCFELCAPYFSKIKALICASLHFVTTFLDTQ